MIGLRPLIAAAGVFLIAGCASVPNPHSRILVNEIVSPYEAGVTKIRVLLPEHMERGKSYAVVYLLPVEAFDGNHWGDGLAEVEKSGLAARYPVIFAEPTFSFIPWYADHPSDPLMRQESYLLHAVLPFVERRYPARRDRDGRLLLGFSKSGWGAFSLMLRHPQVFGKASAFDSPLMMGDLKRGFTRGIFGTQQNFARYQVSRLLTARASLFHSENRFAVLGYHGFRHDLQGAHALMQRLEIVHRYEDGPERDHTWESGWLPDAVAFLVSGTDGAR